MDVCECVVGNRVQSTNTFQTALKKTVIFFTLCCCFLTYHDLKKCGMIRQFTYFYIFL